MARYRIPSWEAITGQPENTAQEDPQPLRNERARRRILSLAPEILAARLSLVRYLYETAVHQSRQTGLRRSFALLTFHDAAEMFLTLALQHHDVYSSRRLYNFAEYWTELEKADVRLTQRGTMESLNRARNNLKHHATMPAEGTVDEARIHARDFFIENTTIAFGINFDEISLLSAVSVFTETRERLGTTRQLIGEARYADALAELAVAFAVLLREFEQACGGKTWLPRSRWGTYQVDVADRQGHSLVDTSELTYAVEQAMEQLAEDAASSIDDLYGIVDLLCVGVDMRRYSRFRSVTPTVHRARAGEYRHFGGRPADATLERCEFCFEFVVDSALHLQDVIKAGAGPST